MKMNMIAVDDERRCLNEIERTIYRAVPDSRVSCFRTAAEALAFARSRQVDVAFLDIRMREMNGLALAKKLKDIHGDTNIIFVTAYSDYCHDAIRLRASGYLLKPVEPEDVAAELGNLRNPPSLADTGIRIQCFGNFEVFVEGVPVTFKRSKSKEALAYLIDRKGAGVTKKELAAVLLEDTVYTHGTQSYMHIILNEMMKSLQEAGAESIISWKRNHYAVDTTCFACDYYDYEKGSASAINLYHGEYMANYSWGEFTAGLLTQQVEE